MASRDSFTPAPFQRETEAEIARLDALLPSDAFARDVRRALYRFALIRNSWGTTNIDAGPIDLERVADLYEIWTRGVTRAQRILPSETEVLNYFALVDDLPTSPFAVSTDDIRQLHRDYFRDVPLHNDARPGLWKERPNVVSGPYGVLETSPPERAEADVRRLLDWVNGPGQGVPVVARAAIFFHDFQRIHPFGDGNGRVGRLATLLLLSIGGLPAIRLCPIDDAINENREEYYASLAAADRGDLERFVSYFAAEVKTGYQRAHVLARRLQGIPPSVPDASRRLLEYLYVHRVAAFKVADVRSFYVGESRSTIGRRLRELETLGLVEGSGTGAGRRYAVRSLHHVAQGPPRGNR